MLVCVLCVHNCVPVPLQRSTSLLWTPELGRDVGRVFTTKRYYPAGGKLHNSTSKRGFARYKGLRQGGWISKAYFVALAILVAVALTPPSSV